MTEVSWAGPGGTVDMPRSGRADRPDAWNSGSVPTRQSVGFAAGHYRVLDTIEDWQIASLDLGSGVLLTVAEDLTIGTPASGLASTLDGVLALDGATLTIDAPIVGRGTISGHGTILGGLSNLGQGSPVNVRADGGTLTFGSVSETDVISISGSLSGSGEIAFVGDESATYVSLVLCASPKVTVAALTVDGVVFMIEKRLAYKGNFEFESGDLWFYKGPLILQGKADFSGGFIAVSISPGESLISLRSDTTIRNDVTIQSGVTLRNLGTVDQSGTLRIDGVPSKVVHLLNGAAGVWNFIGNGSIIVAEQAVGHFVNNGSMNLSGRQQRAGCGARCCKQWHD